MQARIESKIDRIELIVRDRDRAEAVTELYLGLDALIREYRVKRAAYEAELFKLDGDEPYFEERTNDLFQRATAEQVRLGEAYVALQLKLRGMVSREEFEKINRLR